MIEETFFCIRPYVFEERDNIKSFIIRQDKGLSIKDSKIIWLTPQDIDIFYGIEFPSAYFDACLNVMCSGFSETGIVVGDNAIEKFVDICGDNFIQKKCSVNTVRRKFGIKDPIQLDGFKYHTNPIHRSRDLKEAEKEVAYYWNNICNRRISQIVADMVENHYRIKDLSYVYDFHVKLAVELGKILSSAAGANPLVVEISLWLHDIGRILGDSDNHHMQGSFYARKTLTILGVEENIVEKVCHCIEFHRIKNSLTETNETKVVVSADGIANIKCSPLLYYFAFNKKRLPFNLGLEEIQLKVNKSFEKIHDFAKQEVAEEYKQWQDIFKLYC